MPTHTLRRCARASLLLGGLAAAGCGSSPGFATAKHPPAPVLTSGGGPVLASPHIYAVSFSGDPSQADIDAFAAKIGASSYWQAVTREYGVGPATATPVHLSTAAPGTLDDGTIPSWLAGQLDGTHPEWGTPDANSLYVLFYPATTTLTMGGQDLCSQAGGYHDEAVLRSGQSVPFAVIPRCASFGSLTGFDIVSVAASHEIVEASTDPLPNSMPAYQGLDPGHQIWGLLGPEAGDLCITVGGDAVFYKPDDIGYMVQRTWSNVAAMAGDDPCAPSLPREVYFNSVPVLSDSTVIDLGFRQVFSNEAVQIPVGGSKTVDLDLYSDAETSAPWSVKAVDLSEWLGGPQELSFAFDRTTGRNGDVLHMTITVLSADPTFNSEPFLVTSTLGNQSNEWIGVVSN